LGLGCRLGVLGHVTRSR